MTVIVPVLPLLFALALNRGETFDDQEMARRIRGGDRDAFRAFFDQYHAMLYGYLRRRGVGPAVCEDLVQEAFVTIWERRSDIDPDRSIRSFLFRISYNSALNHFRDTAKFAGDEEMENERAGPNPESAAEYALMKETLLEVVERLPQRRRAVFELCFLEDWSYKEAAEALDISVKTVENQMRAALKTLREAFDHYQKFTREE